MRTKKQRGSSLATVLVVMLFVSLLGTALLGAALSNLRRQTVTEAYDQDYYTAQAGLTLAIAALMDESLNPATGLLPLTQASAQARTSLDAYLRRIESQVSVVMVNGDTPQVRCALELPVSLISLPGGQAFPQYAVRIESAAGGRLLTALATVESVISEKDEYLGVKITVEPVH